MLTIMIAEDDNEHNDEDDDDGVGGISKRLRTFPDAM